MSDEIMNTQTGQSGDLAENAVPQNVNGSLQAGVSGQSPDADQWAQREKEILAKAYQQAQSLVDRSANRTTTQIQGVIDQFKRDFGVTLTNEQAQQMAQNQATKSTQNVPVQAQTPAQTAPATDPAYQGFLYYHGIEKDSPVFRQAYQIQNMLGVKLEENDEELKSMLNREQKYKPDEFIQAWKQACINKIIRLRSAQQPQESNPQNNTNMGQLPLVGSRGDKATSYDPKRSSRSYFSQYVSEKKL